MSRPPTSRETLRHLPRELDRRTSDGIEVRLLWRQHDDRVLVSVRDGRTGERFTVEVPEGERPLDVFHHPYAYAAWRGVDAPRQSRMAA